jgi:hypothetical protein
MKGAIGVETLWERRMTGKYLGASIASGLILLAFAASAGAQTINLYQGTSGGTPQSQTWLTYQYNPLATAPSTSSTGGPTGQTTFDTTSDSNTTPDPDDNEEGGWSNYSYNPITSSSSIVNLMFPALNPTSGFSVSWDLAVTSESNTSTNRAGFDVIVLGSDKKGVELGYWGSDVWAQEYVSGTGFERNPLQDSNIQNDDVFDTGPSLIDYVLTIQGGNYTLTANGSTILTGATQDYTGSAMLPYTLPNFVFIGDDTSEAAANVTFTSLAVTVPEPITGMGLVVIGAISLMRRRVRKLTALAASEE